MTKMTVTIYIQLLEEGTPCARPTQAIPLGNDLYKLLPTADYDPEDEFWDYLPGAVVRCEYNAKNWLTPCIIAIEQIEPPAEPARIYLKWLTKLGYILKSREAISLGRNTFKLLPPSNTPPEEGTWEFPVGSVVRCESHAGKWGIGGLVAVEWVG